MAEANFMNAPIKPLQWSEHRKPDEIIRYDHVLAESPIGLFSIEWKSWKEHDSYAVYLDSEYIAVGNDIADAMLIADRRVAEVADNLIDLSSLATVTAQRDAYRAVLEGAEYRNIGGIGQNSVEASRQLGASVATMTKDMAAERDRLLAALIAVVAVADRKTDVFDKAHAAIASVKGGAV